MKDVILLLTTIAAATAAVYSLQEKEEIREDFGTIPAQTIHRVPEAKIQNRYGEAVFSVPPNWQGNLPPRFSNTGYGAYILYNIPDEENLAVPKYPLTFSGNVKEGYSRRREGYAPSPLSTPQNSMSQINACMAQQQQPARQMQDAQVQSCANPCSQNTMMAHNLAQADMQASSFVQDASQGVVPIDEMALPGETQIYNYDRLVYAQKRSRLHGLGDPIRGDLPVVPIQDQWFRPSTRPNIDLRQGAVTTISGHDNITSKQLRALQADYSGKTALAQKDISFDGRSADIIVTAFP